MKLFFYHFVNFALVIVPVASGNGYIRSGAPKAEVEAKRRNLLSPMCVDTTGPHGEEWTDLHGGDCDWYVKYDVCHHSKPEWANHGLTHQEACCACGGGSECYDSTGPHGEEWTDLHGDDCDWYVENDACSITEPTWAKHGMIAEQACCACGGGGSNLVDCYDSTGLHGEEWTDLQGDDCAWYVENDACSMTDPTWAKHGMTAEQACCACGGGVEGSNPRKELLQIEIPVDRAFDVQWNPPGYPLLDVYGLQPPYLDRAEFRAGYYTFDIHDGNIVGFVRKRPDGSVLQVFNEVGFVSISDDVLMFEGDGRYGTMIKAPSIASGNIGGTWDTESATDSDTTPEEWLMSNFGGGYLD